MSYQHSNIVKEIKQRFTIQDAARMIGLSLKKDNGGRMKALCPFHADKNPSLVVWPDEGKWKCFGCDKHGDAIDLVAEAKGMSNSDAIKYLAEELGIDEKPDKNQKKQLGQLVAEFFYRDEGGQVRYKVCRYEHDGKKTFKQFRPDGKGGWIANLDGVERLPYRLPELMESLKRGETIFIPEGEKAVHTLLDLGLAATCNSGGAGKWTDAINKYFTAGAEVVILPDNDKPGRDHAEMVAANLYRQGCKVKVVKLPGIDDLSPKGAAGPENKADIVDWLAAGHTKEELLAVVSKTEYWQPKPEDEGEQGEFCKLLRPHGFDIKEGWTVALRDTKQGYSICWLANFVAWPVAEYIIDDGQTTRRMIKITGRMANGCSLPTISVSADEFISMNWIVNGWGLEPVFKSGQGTKDKLREAVQHLGKNRVKETWYAHTGWRKIGGKWTYLHAGGAIGADGVLVDLSEGGEALTRYRLPDKCEDAVQAVKVAAAFLEVADKRITFPLLAAAFLAAAAEILRAVNIQLDFAIFMVGKAQSGKSSLAALALSFFGDFDKTAFPANFKMTPNSLEKTAFMIKDALLVVDDFHPAQNRVEKEKLKQAAQNLARAYGDGAARVRMGADLRLKAAFRPRGLAIATGEERPDIGESGQARMLFINVKRDDIDYYGKFKEVEANKIWLAKCMVAYITWLAENWDKLKEILPQIYAGARADMQTENSGRANEAAAKLATGIWLFHQFAIDNGEMAESDAVKLLQEGGQILKQLAADNIASLQSERPTAQFITALQELAAAGQVEIISVYHQNKPDEGKFIGCYDTDFLYLLPQMTYKAVSEFYMKQGLQFPVSSGTLWRQLHEEGLLFSRDEVRGRWTIQKRLSYFGNKPVDVILLAKKILGI